jgi:hypothetical protein
MLVCFGLKQAENEPKTTFVVQHFQRRAFLKLNMTRKKTEIKN